MEENADSCESESVRPNKWTLVAMAGDSIGTLQLIKMEINVNFLTSNFPIKKFPTSRFFPTAFSRDFNLVAGKIQIVNIAIYFIDIILTNNVDFIWPHWCRKSLNSAINKNNPRMMPILAKSLLFFTRPVMIFEWSDKFGFNFFSKGFENAMGVGGGFFGGGMIVILNSSSFCRSLTLIGFCVF